MKEVGHDSWQREKWTQSLSDGLVGIFLTPDGDIQEGEFQLPHEGAASELANSQHCAPSLCQQVV